MRAGAKRSWIKVYCYQTLHGSISYQLTQAEQAVWIKLLCLAGLCSFEGKICDNDQRPYPHEFIAHELHISEELLASTLSKCKEEGRITEDEHGLNITNWKTYQSEYQRQKPYRQGKQRGETTQAGIDAARYQNILANKFKEAREKLGRQPTLKEEKAIREEADREYDKEGATE